MPDITEWAPPELFLTHSGVNVFHVYRDDDMNQGPKRFLFTLDATDDGRSFDVRDLDVPSRPALENHPPFMTGEHRDDPGLQRQWDLWHSMTEPAAIKQVLRDAIDAGLLVADPETNADPNAPSGYHQVLVEVRPRKGLTLTAGEALELVSTMIDWGEDEARSSVEHDDPEDTEDARLVLACDFSVELP